MAPLFKTIENVRAELQAAISKPETATSWAIEHYGGDSFSSKVGWDQVMFVRDHLAYAVGALRTGVTVIGEHRSKSIVLPVYEVAGEHFRLTLRYNFYDWKMSYRGRPVPVAPPLLRSEGLLADVYCEGFPPERVFPAFSPGAVEFTCEVYSKYELWALAHALHCSPGMLGQ